MSSVRVLIMAAISALLMMSCSLFSKGEEKKMEAKQSPKYLITVTQGGKLLGDIEIELFPDFAPKHCHNFDSLVSIGFYNGTAFHRVIKGFMIQGGDPNSKDQPRRLWGMGAPGQTTVTAEFSDISHKRGMISAARKSGDINSATSQFFIVQEDAPHLDGQYTIFGKVVRGMDIIDKIADTPTDSRDSPEVKVEMKIIKL